MTSVATFSKCINMLVLTKKQIIAQEIDLFFEKMKTMGLEENEIMKLINERGNKK